MLFEQALKLPAGQQDTFLRQQENDDDLVSEVRDLLEANASADNHWQDLQSNRARLLDDINQLALPDVGQLIGPYKIEEKIGAGGMGVIYRAFDTRLKRQVALKFLSNQVSHDEMVKQRFLAEARAVSQLDHPNICSIHDIDETAQGNMFITMPFYEGETLAAKISRGSLPVNEAIDIAIQISDGLINAHDHDIVHRDIKPANIMLAKDGLVRILDFGVAKVANVHLTGTGVGVGTLAYMAPEQLNGEPVDERVDVWATGAVLYEMLMASPAFPGKDLQQIIKLVFDVNYDPLAELPEHLSAEVCLVLGNALTRDRQLRFENMAVMLNDLIQVRTGLEDHGSLPRSQISARVKAASTDYEWDSDFLDTVTEALLPWLGPITPKMVQRYAKVSGSLDDLVQYLMDVLPDDDACKIITEQIKIRAAMQTSPPAPRSPGNNNPDNAFDPSPAQLAILEDSLLPKLGPIAPVLIRRVAVNAKDWESLCDLLSQYIDNQQDTSKFLKEVAVNTYN
ncbi:MAG: serine/threonine-protein kinase [Gammaproteobacteria bacterium]